MRGNKHLDLVTSARSDLVRERVSLNEDSAENITKGLIKSREWYLLAAQALAITASVILDPVSPQGRAVLVGLVVIQAALAIWAWRNRTGPFSAGPPWGAIWISSTLAMPVLVAHLVRLGEYGATPVCVQMCGYPLAPMLVFALYPWGFPGKQWERRSIEIITLAVVTLEPLVIIYWINGYINQTNITAVLLSAMYVLMMFFGGKGIKRICADAARSQFEILKDAYRKQGELLHGEVSTAVGSIDWLIEQGKYEKIKPRLDQLKVFIDQEHNSLTIAQDQVNVLRAVRKVIEFVEPSLKIAQDIPQGTGYVSQPVGEFISNAAAVLLDNVRKHGHSSAHIKLRLEADVFFLIVSDYGPGLSSTTLDDEATTLYTLREHARTLGGDLRVDTSYKEGARILLFVPNYKPR